MSRIAEVAVDGARTGLRVRVAERWSQRAVGLLGTPSLKDPCGLWLAPCNAVHMFGMRYAIDVAFVAGDGRITRVVPALRPWRAAGCRSARATLELREGLVREIGLRPGQRLALLG